MELNQSGYSISELCKCARISRSSYYKWLNRKETQRDKENKEISNEIIKIYSEVKGIYGYRRITLNLNKTLGSNYNHKRIYRLMKSMNMSAVIRKKRKRYVHSPPQITAENLLNRNFITENINEKWLTDVTEFKVIGQKQKIYLCSILDLYDKSIVAYTLSFRNDNKLVFDTFDKAIALNPTAKPIFHSDRGFQFTSKVFKFKLDEQGMIQSMSRVGKCIDNGPMEAFWGTIKSEMYYIDKFYSIENLIQSIKDYIEFYNNKRFQAKLKCLAPMEYRNQALSA